VLRSALLHDVPHGFTGRAEGDLRRDAAGETARRAVVAALGGTGDLVTARQVHGARVVDEHAGDVEADAVVSTTPGRVVGVRVADCAPILLVAPGPFGSPGAVAAVHAGWRGTAAGIVRAALTTLCERAGAPPSDVRAAVGPCICGACYEVGPEVMAAIGEVAPGSSWVSGANRVDLAEANAAILREAGVTVDVLGVCTRCAPGYWSHRRDGDAAGRQAAVVRL
jgi:YfiH family protein